MTLVFKIILVVFFFFPKDLLYVLFMCLCIYYISVCEYKAVPEEVRRGD